MGYDNNGGCCNSGFGFPFGGFMNGFGGFGFDALILLLFFGLMGGGMWGGFGGFGGGFGGFAQSTTTAAETAALISQQNTADRVAAIGADVRQVLGQTGGIIEAVNTVGNRAQDGFARVDSNLCQLGHNISQQFNAQTMQGMNMHNDTTALLNNMRAEQAKCCCESKFQAAADKCEILGAISASESRILAQMNTDKFERMQEKLNAANERIATLKNERDNSQQTQTLLAAIQANGCASQCQPCNPCGGGYGLYGCNPCVGGVQRAVDQAIGTRIGELLFPTTAAAAA